MYYKYINNLDTFVDSPGSGWDTTMNPASLAEMVKVSLNR